jgi:hypothetical protein
MAAPHAFIAKRILPPLPYIIQYVRASYLCKVAPHGSPAASRQSVFNESSPEQGETG